MTDPIVNRRKSIFLGIICLVIFAGIIVAGLWPFKFWPENKVEWLKDQNGVRFYGQGIIYSEKEIAMAPSFRSSNLPSSISVEICLQPELKQVLTLDASSLSLTTRDRKASSSVSGDPI